MSIWSGCVATRIASLDWRSCLAPKQLNNPTKVSPQRSCKIHHGVTASECPFQPPVPSSITPNTGGSFTAVSDAYRTEDEESMRINLCICMATVLAFSGALLPAHGATAIVNGNANLNLAGRANGYSCCSGDSAPAQSPTPVSGLSLVPGDTLAFSVSGEVSYSGAASGRNNPDGSPYAGVPRNFGDGISSPINLNRVDALVGLFLGAGSPTGAPIPSRINYSGGLNFRSIAPQVGQIFFIGNGLTGDTHTRDFGGTVQTFVVPTGATRLYLGTTDGSGWYNNNGSFNVEVTSIPQQSPLVRGAPLPSSTASTTPASIPTVTPACSTLSGAEPPICTSPGKTELQLVRDRIQRHLAAMPAIPQHSYSTALLPALAEDIAAFSVGVGAFWLQSGNPRDHYNEFYFAALDYRSMAWHSLHQAELALQGKDLQRASYYVDSADRYLKLFNLAMSGANAVELGDVNNAAIIASGIYTASKISSKFAAAFVPGPWASRTIDGLFMATDFLVDSNELSLDEAAKNLMTSAVVNVALSGVKVKSLGNKTLADVLNRQTRTLIGSSKLYPTLVEIYSDPELAKQVLSFMARSGVHLTTEAVSISTEAVLKTIAP